MSKVTLLVVTVVVLAASAAIVGWSFFGLGASTSQPTKSTQTTRQITPSAQTGSSDTLPVSLSNPKVSFANVTYYFSGALIKDIKEDPKGKELVTSLRGYGFKTKILVDKNTKVVFLNDKEETPASSSDLQTGQGVRITAQYNLTKKKWSFPKVIIIKASTISAELK